jgi:hypothetical protein
MRLFVPMLKMMAMGDELKAFIEEFELLDARLLQSTLDPTTRSRSRSRFRPLVQILIQIHVHVRSDPRHCLCKLTMSSILSLRLYLLISETSSHHRFSVSHDDNALFEEIMNINGGPRSVQTWKMRRRRRRLLSTSRLTECLLTTQNQGKQQKEHKQQEDHNLQ